jgi:hypothetical protein
MTIQSNFPAIKPTLLLDFANVKALDPRITFTRASTATYFDQLGVMQTAASGVARFDHNPLTDESLGLLIEEQRTNLVLNSATLSTQNVTVTAVAHTLSFYGTGTVTLSGVSTAGPLVGTAVYPTRVSLTFTPTAGTLTLTVSGSVQFAQLEAGAFATSYIPTVASQVTRSGDIAVMTGTNFSSWYSQIEGTFYAQFRPIASDFGANKNMFLATDNTASNFVGFRCASTGTQASLAATTLGVSQANLATGVFVAGTSYKLAGGYKANDFAVSRDGATVLTDTSGTVPVVDRAEIGCLAGVNIGSQHLSKLAYYPMRVTNAQLQALTS